MRQLLLCLMLLVTTTVLAGDLATLADMRTALADDLGLQDTTVFWNTAHQNRLVNRAITFVEEALKQRQVILEFAVSAGTFIYDLGDTVAQNSVAAAYILSTAGELKVQGLAFREMSEFGASEYSEPKVYYLWSNSLVVAAPAIEYGTLYVMARMKSADLDLDTSSVQITQGAKRELAVGYALIQGFKAEQRHNLATQEFQEWLTKFQLITGIAIKEPEKLGKE